MDKDQGVSGLGHLEILKISQTRTNESLRGVITSKCGNRKKTSFHIH